MHHFFKSVLIALQNIKANPLHTFLSTLGIIIGVASLVGILALGDGLEQSARNQLSQTTTVQSFTITSNSTRQIDGINVRIENRPKMDYTHAREIEAMYSEAALVEYVAQRAIELTYQDSTYAVYLSGSMEKGLELLPEAEIVDGRFFYREEIDDSSKVIVVSSNFVSHMELDSATVVGSEIEVLGESYSVIGLLEVDLEGPRVVIPITSFDKDGSNYPALTMVVNNVEDIPMMKEEMSEWLDERFEQGSEGFSLISDDFWVEQLSEGILMFKIIMGAITGISVLVGGIGVMNVLLISVTERTREIGIRKATGAKRFDILFQFLAESITISFVGAVLGWLLAMMALLAFIPIVNNYVSIEFALVINPMSILVVLIIAILIGVVFGTYPAWRAAQLDPIDAIRHE